MPLSPMSSGRVSDCHWTKEQNDSDWLRRKGKNEYMYIYTLRTDLKLGACLKPSGQFSSLLKPSQWLHSCHCVLTPFNQPASNLSWPMCPFYHEKHTIVWAIPPVHCGWTYADLSSHKRLHLRHAELSVPFCTWGMFSFHGRIGDSVRASLGVRSLPLSGTPQLARRTSGCLSNTDSSVRSTHAGNEWHSGSSSHKVK